MDLSNTIKPAADQLTADDCLAGPITIKITKVTGNEGNAAQPVNIHFEGDNGKPYRPAKIMRRVLVSVYGPDSSKYIGQSITLYRDPDVRFGGVACGGLRISHMTGIDKVHVLALQMSKGNKKPFSVQPLVIREQAQQQQPSASQPSTDPYANYAKEFKRRLDNEPWQAVDSWWQNTAADREGMAQERIGNMEAALAAKIEKENA